MASIDVIDSIRIRAEPEQVFNTVADYPGIGRWLPVYRCRLIDAEQLAEGVLVEHRYGYPPFVLSRFTRRVERIVAGSRLEERYVDGDLRGSGVWSFERDGDHTVAAYHCQVTANTLFTRLSFLLLGKRAHSNVYQPLLAALKAHCEASAG